jgi:PhnB protein
MKAFHTYLNFDGNAREAMTFYKQALGAELFLQSFKDAGTDAPPGGEDRIIHARLQKGNAILMASDTMPGMPFKPGNNFSVSIDCDTDQELDGYANALSQGGKVVMAPQDTFWNARFGMVTDKYGVGWMFNCDHAKK